MECISCGKMNDDSARFCRFCGKPLPRTKDTEDGGPNARVYAKGKTPMTAALFSVVPGGGQFYNGDLKKGVLILSVFLICCSLTFPTGCASDFVAIAVYIWAASNAWNVAAMKTPLWT